MSTGARVFLVLTVLFALLGVAVFVAASLQPATPPPSGVTRSELSFWKRETSYWKQQYADLQRDYNEACARAHHYSGEDLCKHPH